MCMRQSMIRPSGLLPRPTFVGLLWKTRASANLICFKRRPKWCSIMGHIYKNGNKWLDSIFQSIYDLVCQKSTFESLKNACKHCNFISGSLSLSVTSWLRSGDLWMQKIKFHPVRTQSLKVFPLKPGVGQYIAIHAMLTARDFFLAYF